MTSRFLAMIVLLAGLVASGSADAILLTFRCTVQLTWAKNPMDRLIVVDTDQASVRDGALTWQDRRIDPLSSNETEHVHADQGQVEWGMSETNGGGMVSRYRIDLRTGGYRYDNAVQNFGHGHCRPLNLVS